MNRALVTIIIAVFAVGGVMFHYVQTASMFSNMPSFHLENVEGDSSFTEKLSYTGRVEGNQFTDGFIFHPNTGTQYTAARSMMFDHQRGPHQNTVRDEYEALQYFYGPIFENDHFLVGAQFEHLPDSEGIELRVQFVDKQSEDDWRITIPSLPLDEWGEITNLYVENGHLYILARADDENHHLTIDVNQEEVIDHQQRPGRAFSQYGMGMEMTDSRSALLTDEGMALVYDLVDGEVKAELELPEEATSAHTLYAGEDTFYLLSEATLWKENNGQFEEVVTIEHVDNPLVTVVNDQLFSLSEQDNQSAIVEVFDASSGQLAFRADLVPEDESSLDIYHGYMTIH
ncbi:hypothetical protein JCM19037_2004 [Geomicrobium sp. JCM 19037]|uniref:hypothetical protein n=1 Tax=Geomicrobium sp. JCM 19037 TaxID=1460634 RepID=UPI00045F4751|nr:hypothetical protein [Geomicrobium sp. JCM 19037]GAK03665.1 hypothetical protein JCM19037_2004 [Geomicrobium sp. JCM 19037]